MAEVIDIERARDERSQSETTLYGRVPPHDLDAEAAVLSSILLASGSDDGGLALVADFLRPEHFYSEAHRRIYEAALELRRVARPVDVVTVGTWLKERDRIAQVGGMSFLTELLNAAPAVANIVPYARTIHDRYRERQIIWTAQRISARGYLGIEDTQAYADDATRSLADIARASVGARIESNVSMIKRLLDAASARSAAKTKVPLGIPTGIAAYDEEWGGWHGKEMTVVGARKGTGKTALAVQQLAHVAKQKLGVLLFSQDSPRDDLGQNLISHVAKVDSKRFRNGDLSADEWRRVTSASQEIASWQFWIDDTRKIHVGQIRSRSLATADDSSKRDRIPLGLIIVDYIQQIAPAPGWEQKKKHEHVAHTARELKSLALSMQIPIVVMAQQKPPHNGKEVFEIRDSLEVENEADNLFFIEKLAVDKRRLRCMKVRRGRDDRHIDLGFEGATRTFTDAKFEPESRKYVDRARGVTSPVAETEERESVWKDDDGTVGALVDGGG